MVTQEAMTRNERYLTLNMNVELGNVAEMLQGSAEPIY
jgi:hypothetical protein